MVAFVLGASFTRARADDANNVILVRMLKEGQNYRARAGAASVIGHRRDATHRPDVEGALRDEHPIVRAAAASALGRIGSRSSLPPLQGVAKRDPAPVVAREARDAIDTIQHQPGGEPEPVVPSEPRFALMLGQMHNQSAFRAPQLTDTLGVAVQRGMSSLRGAAVVDATTGRASDAAERGLLLFRMDGNLTSLRAAVRNGVLSVHCEVSLLVMDQATGALRTLFKGAATGVELPDGNETEQALRVAPRVVDAAVRSALRNAEDVIAQAAQTARTL